MRNDHGDMQEDLEHARSSYKPVHNFVDSVSRLGSNTQSSSFMIHGMTVCAPNDGRGTEPWLVYKRDAEHAGHPRRP